MRDWKWINRPICGALGTMRHREDLTEVFKQKNHKPITIDGLGGYFCSECSEGFFNAESTKRINLILGGNK